MSRIIVVTNPAHDVVTQYLDAWQEEIIGLAKKQKDTLIFELNGASTTKKDLTNLIEQKNPQFVIFNGHGSCDSIFGFQGCCLIKAEDNDNILAKKIVHSLTCSSAKILGPQCIKIGTLSYIGYDDDFEMYHLNKGTKKERRGDGIANLFLEPAFEAILSLVKGCPTEIAFNNSQNKYLSNLKSVIARNDPDLNIIAASLYHNLRCQTCLGDGGACF